MKRAGFTMIELIFVIVILGILAAVAIPKLAATRTDAQIAKIATNVATLVSDIGAHYTSQGSTATNWDDMTNVQFSPTAGAGSTSDGSTVSTSTIYLGDGTDDCISFALTTDGNLTVADTSGTTVTCASVATKSTSLIKTHTFGGIGIQ